MDRTAMRILTGRLYDIKSRVLLADQATVLSSLDILINDLQEMLLLSSEREKGILRRLKEVQKNLNKGKPFLSLNSLNWLVNRIESGDSLDF